MLCSQPKVGCRGQTRHVSAPRKEPSLYHRLPSITTAGVIMMPLSTISPMFVTWTTSALIPSFLTVSDIISSVLRHFARPIKNLNLHLLISPVQNDTLIAQHGAARRAALLRDSGAKYHAAYGRHHYHQRHEHCRLLAPVRPITIMLGLSAGRRSSAALPHARSKQAWMIGTSVKVASLHERSHDGREEVGSENSLRPAAI